MKRRAIGPRVVVVLMSVALVLGVAEIALRLVESQGGSGGTLDEQLLRSDAEEPGAGTGRFSLLGLVRASAIEDVVYELKPNLNGRFKDATLRTNSAGLKESTDYGVAKPAGVFRIVGLGDSVMFGWGVDQGSSYLDVLESRFASESRARSVEVINCAVPGYNTTMEVALLEHRCLTYDPDLILVHFVGNDLGRPHFMQPETAGGLRLVALLRRAIDPESAPTFDLLPHDLGEIDAGLRSETRGRYDWMVGADAYLDAMGRLAELAADRNVPVWILMMGDADARPLVDEVAGMHGMKIIDPTPLFRQVLADHPDGRQAGLRKMFTIPNDGHPNTLGHSLWAEALFVSVDDLLAELP